MKPPRFGLLTALMFLIEILILVGFSSSGIFDNVLLHVFKGQVSNSKTVLGQFPSIFLNNLKVATIEFIPILGQAIFIYSNINDGVITSSIGLQRHVPGLFIFASVAIEPHTWIELYSYAIATSFSLYVIYLAIRNRNFLRNLGSTTVYMYCFVVLELALAALFESVEIFWQLNFSPPPLLFLSVIWVPGAIVMIFLGLLFRKILRNMNKLFSGISA
ncbi:MAG: hypothetical protein AMDU1_APLC00047G0002 [Thermoplasmatales archaeon A-plasma]|nr:MAG: hypothetical protein AMDU1_APLC00047G0002 [Thermoplasmatales archaeon A-plasma]